MSKTSLSVKKDKLSYSVELSIKESDLKVKMSENFIEFKKTLEVKGFRKGSVPDDYIEKNYKDKIIEDSVVDLTNEHVNKFIKEENLKLANAPKIVNIKDEKNGDYKVSVSLEIFPEIPEIDFKKVKISFSLPSIDDKKVEEEFDQIVKQISPEKKAEEGTEIKNSHVTDIYFKGFLDGNEIKNAFSESYKLEIGSKSFIPGFEDQLIGHKKGDHFDIEVKFPEDYQEKTLEGKNVKFEIKINEIYEKELLDKNSDETAKKIGFESIEKIKEFIKNNKQSQSKSALFTIQKEALINFIKDKYCDFEIPESLIKKETELELKNNPDKKENDILKTSKKFICFSYIFFDLIKKYSIECTNKDVEDFIYQQSIYNRISLNELKKKYKENSSERENLEGFIKENKLFSIIISECQNDIKSIDESNFQDYLKNLSEGKEKILVC